MKKFILTLTVIASTAFAFGQVTTPDTTKKEFKNVISIDATGLLQQFFNFNTQSYYSSSGIIRYRRVFKSNALRFGVGGNFLNNNSTSNDTLPEKQTTNNFNISIGFEHYSYLSKRWNLYFGADAITNYSYYDNQSSWTVSTSYRRTSTNYGYGVSPLLGLQFKINSRMSLATETSCLIMYTIAKGSTTQTPPSPIEDNHSKSTGLVSTFFYAPTAINFRILF